METEIKNPNVEKEESTSEGSGEGDKPKPIKSIEDANAAAERMEKATEASKIENDRTENLKVEATLGGSTEAGKAPIEPKAETDEEYTNKFMKGEVNPFAGDGTK